MQDYGIPFLFGILAMIFIILYFKQQIRALLTVLMRGFLCLALIWSVNQVLFYFGYSLEVGIGPISFLTCILLGFPGVCLLYGVLLI